MLNRDVYLIARVYPEEEQLWWATWRVAGNSVAGPRALGNWIRFIPSDWRPVDGPLPEDIRRVAEWVASIEDLDQVGIRDGRGWIPRPGPSEPQKPPSLERAFIDAIETGEIDGDVEILDRDGRPIPRRPASSLEIPPPSTEDDP